MSIIKLSAGNYRDQDANADICFGLEGYDKWVLFIDDKFIADGKTKRELVGLIKEHKTT
jgi:hypothetical protein